jgi:glycosyl transferase family 25
MKPAANFLRAMQITYINLADRTDRRGFMEKQFAALGLVATRLEAMTRADVSEGQRDRYCNPARRWSMTDGQFACNLSHIKAWRALLDSDAPRALILEDDARLSASLPRFLAAIDAQNITVPLIRIESWPTEARRYRAADVNVLPDITLRRCLEQDAGAAGYIVTRQAAARLIAAPELNTMLIDGFLYNPHGPVGRRIEVRQTDPALCIQLWREKSALPEAGGSLGAGLREHKRERKRHPLTKFTRQAEGWLTYDARRVAARIAQAGWRDVTEEIIGFRPD